MTVLKEAAGYLQVGYKHKTLWKSKYVLMIANMCSTCPLTLNDSSNSLMVTYLFDNCKVLREKF